MPIRVKALRIARHPDRIIGAKGSGQYPIMASDAAPNGAHRRLAYPPKEPEAGYKITLPRRHSAIRSPPRLGRSAASIARRDGVEYWKASRGGHGAQVLT